ncbi:exodeoxyribonuclease VII small subunit [Sandaracinobacteroides sp. A072]|uniref:exodeoxyribonuclease VII small subunit n=1 Tax=Sandaracinobacteroides sp. A072 TaxID=3461146 RepID=UPI004041D603
MTTETDISALSFEAALQRLEAIVRDLESGDASLEASIGLYEEAQKLKAHCEAKLSSAEARIAQLQLDGEGRPVGETGFGG